jgi:hypothetical protein
MSKRNHPFIPNSTVALGTVGRLRGPAIPG